MPRAKRSTTRRTGSRPSRPPGLSTDRLREIYYYLKMNRLIEERLSALYRQGKVQGGLYSSRGQEAISVGSAYALGPQDILAPMIRNLGAMLVKGVRPLEFFLQYLQREGSPCKGRDTSLHFGGIERGERNLTFAVLCKICNGLHCDICQRDEGNSADVLRSPPQRWLINQAIMVAD